MDWMFMTIAILAITTFAFAGFWLIERDYSRATRKTPDRAFDGWQDAIDGWGRAIKREEWWRNYAMDDAPEKVRSEP